MTHRIGILGAGNISEQYAKGLALFPELEVVRVGDVDLDRAARLATTFDIPMWGSANEVFADDDVDIVVSLTPPALHAATVRDSLDAGKSVYVEKPLATSLDEGRALLALETASVGRIGSAPDTFLGSAAQTARAALDDGLVGKVIGATAFVRSSRVETWHPDPTFFFQPGGGPVMDMGPYYVSALVHLLGPVARIVGAGRIGSPTLSVSSAHRTTETIDVNTNTHAAGVLVFTSGALATTQFSFDVWDTELPHLEIYGTEGTLSVHNPGQFDGDVRLKRHEDENWRALEPVRTPWGKPGTPEQRRRGLGVADLAATLDGEVQRTSSVFAFHVLEVLLALDSAGSDGGVIDLSSTTDRPLPLPRTTAEFIA